MAKNDAIASLGLNISDFRKGFETALRDLDGFQKSAAKSGRSVGGLSQAFRFLRVSMVGAFAAGGFAAIAQSIRATVDYTKAIQELGREAGITGDKLVSMQEALRGKLSVEDTNAALLRMNDLLREARGGSVSAQQTLAGFGSTVDDTADSALAKYAAKMTELGRSQVAIDQSARIFGNTLGSKVLPAAIAGSDALDKMSKRANEGREEFLSFGEQVSKTFEGLRDGAKNSVLFLGESIQNLGQQVGKAAFGGGSRADTFMGAAEQQLRGEGRVTSQGRLFESEKRAIRTRAKLLAEEEEKALASEKEAAAAESAEFARINSTLNAQIALNEQRAIQRQGAYEQELVMEKEILRLQAERNTLERNAPDETEKLSALDAEIRQIRLGISLSQQQREDEIRGLRMATDEAEMRLKGQQSMADQLAITAKYENDILKALREQNYEAASLLIKQRDLERTQANAAQKRKTPREKANERREARALARDAKKQEARDAEQLRRAEGGLPNNLKSGGYGGVAGVPGSRLADNYGSGGSFGQANPRAAESRLTKEALEKRDLLQYNQTNEAKLNAERADSAAAVKQLATDVGEIKQVLNVQ